MTSFTLRQLRYCEALARTRHFGRAAEACAISQPALSMQIKELEDALGAALFERGSREVRPTPFGETFLPRARDVLRAVEELDELARAARDREPGRLRLGVIPTIAPYLLPRLVRDLAGRRPGLDLQVRETLTATLIHELGDARIDAAIVALPVSEPSLVEVPLFEESFVLVRPREDAGKPAPGSEELREMRLLLLEEGHCFREQALSFCDLRSGRPRELLDATSLSTLVQMVGAGIGVTLIPEMAVAVETRGGPVSVTRFAEPQPSRTVGMIWRKTSPLAPALAEIAQVVRRAGAALRDERA